MKAEIFRPSEAFLDAMYLPFLNTKYISDTEIAMDF